MLDPLDPLMFELCFPGSMTGETEVTCPACSTLLTVPVDDPLGSQTYRCCQCQTVFVVNWVT
jgi:hypothetical protein